MARVLILAVLIGLLLAGIFNHPAKAAPSFELGPGGFSFWFGDDDRRRYRRGRVKCKSHWHTRGRDYRHYHCISRHKSWRKHRRYGHRY